MTQDELDAFTDLMMRKAAFGHGFVNGRYHWRPGDEEEALRGLIQNVIVDTELWLSGGLPLEEWDEK